ncbi:hypothetical protein ABPG73_022319 [Tetrahymena malaccensis]
MLIFDFNFLSVQLIQDIQSSQSNFSLFVSDPNFLFRVDFNITGYQLTKQIDSLTYSQATAGFPILFEGTQQTYWYYLKENKQLIIPLNSNFESQTYSFAFSYLDITFIKRQFYYSTEWTKIFVINLNQTNYFVTAYRNSITVSQDSPAGKIIWQQYLYDQIYGKENDFIQVQNYALGFFILVNSQQIYYIEILKTQNVKVFPLNHLDLSLTKISNVITPFKDQENYLWFIIGMPFKDNNEEVLFWMIDFNNDIIEPLITNNLEDDSNQTCYTLCSEKNNSIVGLYVLGNAYVWNSKQISEFKYKKTITEYQCYKSAMGQLYNYGEIVFLIAMCDDHKVVSFNLDTGDTQLLTQMSSSSNHINSFEDIQLLGFGERDTGNVFLFRFDQSLKKFQSFLKIQTIKYKDETLNLNYLPESQLLFIQYYYSNYYFPIGDCLKNQPDNLFGLGTIQSPFLSSLSLRTSFLQCGLKINNIVEIANIDNVNYQSWNSTQNCYFLQISNSSVILQNLNISNKNFSDFQDLIQVSNSKQLILDNFTLQNSILNSQFSIVRQLSDTNITIRQMIIQNNLCDVKQNTNSQSVGQLFQAGQFNVSNMQIIGNQFCNQKIFSTISSINQKNYNILFENIEIKNNKFYTMASHLFYNTIYTFNPLPQHSLFLSNIYSSDNQYLPDLYNEYTNNLSQTSLILLDKVLNVTIHNITSINQDQITFLRASQSQISQLFNISCANYYIFYINSKKIKNSYAGCLQFIEVYQISLNLFKSSFINAIDNSIISIQNINYKNSLIELINIEIFNSSFHQTLANSYSNPLFISTDQLPDIKILNSNFHDNILYGFINSQTQSTTAIQIINSQGKILIQDTQFSNSKSDSPCNFAFIQCNNTQINRCQFLNSSFDLQDNTSQFMQQGGCLRIQSNALQLNNSIFSQSTANIASFIYLEPLSNQMDNIIFNTSFSQGYSNFDGGAIYLDSQNSYISLNMNQCNFTDIYSLYPLSSAISIKNQATLSQLRRLYNFSLNNILLKNMLGNIDSMFLNTNNADINIQNLTHQKIYKHAHFTNSENLNLKINNATFSNLATSTESSLPLLIKSTNSTIQLRKLNISQCQFMTSLIEINFCKLEISESIFNNIFQIKHQRILQNSIIAQQIKNSSLIQLNESYLLFHNNTFFNQISCLKNCYVSCLSLTQSTFIIQNTYFIQNKAVNGGAIAILGNSKINNLIQNSSFIENSAINNGGAIYLEAQTKDTLKIQIYESQFHENQAQQGYGGAFYFIAQNRNSRQQQIMIKNKQIVKKSIISFNEAQQYGDDQFSYPTQLYLTIQKMDPITNVFIFDDLNLIGIPGSNSVIEFVSESIKIFNNETETYENSYTFEVHVNFRYCAYGEIINQYNNYQECQTCEYDKYSLDFEACYACPTGGFCQNGIVNLQSGFWRKYEYSIEIIQCYNRLQNCVGKSFGNSICTQGNIGPLCEECDIYGEFWNQSYTRSQKYQCALCESLKYSSWKLTLTILWITTSIFLTVQSDENFFLKSVLVNNIRKKKKKVQIDNSKIPNESFIQQHRSKQFDNIKSSSKNFVKIFTNYAQIVSSAVTFNLKIDTLEEKKNQNNEEIDNLQQLESKGIVSNQIQFFNRQQSISALSNKLWETQSQNLIISQNKKGKQLFRLLMI